MGNLADIRKKHEEMLWNTVRVRTEKTGGSGTIIYSKPDKEDKFATFILTCDHVIKSACEIQEKFDHAVGMERKKEFRKPVSVEFFDYEELSRCRGARFATKASMSALYHAYATVQAVQWAYTATQTPSYTRKLNGSCQNRIRPTRLWGNYAAKQAACSLNITG